MEARKSGRDDELWRVFVLLRHRSGVYGRTVRASGPLAAEDAASIEDGEVLATLGSRLVGDRVPAAGIESGYRSFVSVDHRFLEMRMRRNGSSGSTRITPLPVVEVLTATPDQEPSGTRDAR